MNNMKGSFLAMAMMMRGLASTGSSMRGNIINDIDLRVTDAQRAMIKPLKLSKKAKAKLKKLK